MRTEIYEFAEEMEKKMEENLEKGDSWKRCPLSFLVEKLDEEMEEAKAFLQYHKGEDNYHKYLDTQELPDIANVCMMLWNRRKEFS